MTPGEELLQILKQRNRWTSPAILLRRSTQFEFQDDLELVLQQMVSAGHVVQAPYGDGTTVVYRLPTSEDQLNRKAAQVDQLYNELMRKLQRARQPQGARIQ